VEVWETDIWKDKGIKARISVLGFVDEALMTTNWWIQWTGYNTDITEEFWKGETDAVT